MAKPKRERPPDCPRLFESILGLIVIGGLGALCGVIIIFALVAILL